MFYVLVSAIIVGFAGTSGPINMPIGTVLAEKTMSLETRYAVESVNEVFKQNILLTIAYMENKELAATTPAETLDKPFRYELTLRPGEVFAFHDALLPEYQDKVVKAGQAHFIGQEGFKSDGYLMGDGVCHLASLINYAAKDAGLEVVTLVNHDFATIPEVPREYGVSIYATPLDPVTSAQQNLYVTNSFLNDVKMIFDYQNSQLKVSIVESAS